jgi:HK97 gp10 family phage protein
MITTEVTITGGKELQLALQTAGPRLAREALGNALNAGADIFLGRAKERAPVLKTPTVRRRGGELRDAIAKTVHINAKGDAGTGRVGLAYEGGGSQSPAVYGLWVEFGSVHNTPQPYMRPAFDEGKIDAAIAFAVEIRKGVDSLAE